MVGLYYSASILAGRASAPYVLPPCKYAALYTSKHGQQDSNACCITLGRRKVRSLVHSVIESSAWEFISFEDYVQAVDDGHNTISLGVCTGDGTIQISFDHHCDR
jgi:hypothetical protein